MTLRPCLTCGTPSDDSRCPEHRAERERTVKGTARERGYSSSWDRLSRRARKLQPFCEVCGAPDDLQADHTPEAWARVAAGKSIRLRDVRVLCGFHNREAGAARGPRTRGEAPSERPEGPQGWPKSALHTGPVRPHPAGTGAVEPVSTPDGRLTTDGTRPLDSERFQTSAQAPDVRLGFPELRDPLRYERAVEVVEAAVLLDDPQRVSPDVERGDPVHGVVGIPVSRPSHVTTIAVTEAAS